MYWIVVILLQLILKVPWIPNFEFISGPTIDIPSTIGIGIPLLAWLQGEN